jgi:hypothetical protein
MDQPFYFIGDELIKELNLDKKNLNGISLKPNPNIFKINSNVLGDRGGEELGLTNTLELTNFNHLTDYNFVKNDVFSGIDWIYTFVESMYAYNFRIFYYKYHNTFFDDSCDYFYNLF